MKTFKRIPVSPPHLIDAIVLATVLFASLIAIVGYHITLFFADAPDDFYWSLYLCWGVYFCVLGIVTLLTYRGIMVAKLHESYAESLLLKKRCCRLNFEEVQYVSFMRSANYGKDAHAGYIVLSAEPISGKSIALSFHVKTQIVIRVSSKNYTTVKDLLKPLQIEPYLPNGFKSFQESIFDRQIHLKKQNEKDWSYHVALLK